MTLVYVLGGLLAAVVGLAVVSRLAVLWSIRRRQGRPAPALEGRAGRTIEKGRPALFYFYSPACGACRSMTPVVQRMAERDRNVFAVDVSQDFATARQFGVMATPTTVLVARGVVERILVGPQPETTLRGLLAPG